MIHRTRNTLKSLWSAFEKYIGYIVLLALFFYQRTEASKRAKDLLELYDADQLGRSIVILESSQRGYLYTADPDLKEDYLAGVRAYRGWLVTLRAAMQDNPQDLRDLDVIEALADKKIGEMSSTVQAFDSGNTEAAKRIVLTRAGQRYMAQIRDALLQFKSRKEIQAISRSTLL